MNGKILGGILGSFEDDFEKESSLVSAVAQGVGEAFQATVSLVQEAVKTEPESETKETAKFSSGSIDFKNQAKIEQLQKQQEQQAEQLKKQAGVDRKKAFFQALKEDADKVQRENDRVFEEEMNDIITNLPTEQKNQLLHYQASYKDRSIYQRAELRKKLIEQQKKTEKQEKAASIPSPAKQPSAMEGAFEGRSGTQGGGSANLSAQAVG